MCAFHLVESGIFNAKTSTIMGNMFYTQSLTLLYLAFILSGAQALMCWQDCARERLRIVNCGGNRSCMIIRTFFGLFRSCASQFYPTGLYGGEGYDIYYCNANVCNLRL